MSIKKVIVMVIDKFNFPLRKIYADDCAGNYIVYWDFMPGWNPPPRSQHYFRHMTLENACYFGYVPESMLSEYVPTTPIFPPSSHVQHK